MQKTTWKSLVILWGSVLAGLLWLFWKMAMAADASASFEGWKEAFFQTLRQPFTFSVSGKTAAFLLAACLIWGCLLASSLKYMGKWRRGAEHGSSDWGSAKKTSKKYIQAKEK